MCGLWCIVAVGEINDKATGVVGPHAWNVIRIDGKYYHLDVTQMLSINSTIIKPFRYLYYNYSDSEIRINHIWNVKLPSCTNVYTDRTSASNTTSGITAISTLYEVRVGLTETLNNKGKQFSFRSNIKCDNDTELMKLINLATSTAIKTSVNKVSSAQVSVQGGFVTVSFTYK